jgi:hypothetical protein
MLCPLPDVALSVPPPSSTPNDVPGGRARHSPGSILHQPQHRRARGILDLEPGLGAPRTAGAVAPLAHEALKAEPAGVVEHDLAVAFNMLVELYAVARRREELFERITPLAGPEGRGWPAAAGSEPGMRIKWATHGQTPSVKPWFSDCAIFAKFLEAFHAK